MTMMTRPRRRIAYIVARTEAWMKLRESAWLTWGVLAIEFVCLFAVFCCNNCLSTVEGSIGTDCMDE